MSEKKPLALLLRALLLWLRAESTCTIGQAERLCTLYHHLSCDAAPGLCVAPEQIQL